MATANIIERLFAYVPDRALVLGGTDFVRPLSFRNRWTRIRLGILCSVPDQFKIGLNALDCTFYMGLCSGTDYPVGSTSTRNFVGASFVGTAALGSTKTLAYTTTTSSPRWVPTAGQIFRKFNKTFVVNATTMTAPTIAVDGVYTQNYGDRARRSPLIIDINRPATTGVCTIILTGYTAAPPVLDFAPHHLLSAVDQTTGTPTVNGVALTALQTQTLAIDEMMGPLDCFNIYWQRGTYPLYIYAMAGVVVGDSPYPAEATTYGGDPVATGAIETFDLYATGTTTGLPNYGTNWPSSAVYTGSYPNPAAVVGLAGSSGGYPDDAFEQYGSGAVVISGVTINAGTGWNGAGSVY